MWEDSESKADRATRLAEKIQCRRDEGQPLNPLTAPRQKINATFWGQAWSQQLAEFELYTHSLRSGRTLLRKGQVFDLTITPGTLTATVADGDLWDVRILIDTLDEDHWQQLVAQCAGQVGSMLDLLAGRLGDDTLRTLTHPTDGLLPQPGQIRCICNCIDDADPCKHAAAVLYGASLSLDADPTQLFTLRAIDATALLNEASADTARQLDSTPRDLADTDLSTLFGIDLSTEPD